MKSSPRSTVSRNSLHSFAQKGKLNPLKILVSQGLNINSVDKINRTALHVAALEGNLEIVGYLLQKKALVNCQDIEGYTPLHLAAMHGHIDVVQNLLATEEVNINCQSNNLYTPLHLVALKGNLEMLNYLVNNGAVVHARSNDDDNALHLACAAGHPCIVKKLIRCGVNVNDNTKFLWRPIHCAILGKWYLNRKRPNEGLVPLWRLTTIERNYRLEIIDELAVQGAELNQFNGFPTPLHLSVHASLCKRLIELGANINGYDHLGKTPLHRATERNIPDVVEVLLSAGAYVDAKKDSRRVTALHLAIHRNNERIASLLINAGAYLNGLHFDEASPILLAHYQKIKTSLFYLLIDGGVNMNILLPGSSPFLHQFFLLDYDNEIYGCLFDQFLNFNAVDNRGYTPLAVLFSRDRYRASNSTKFIIKLIVKMESNNKFIMNELNWRLISKAYLKLYNQYKEELELLKKQNIWGCKNLYDFLVQPMKQLIQYSRNVEITKIFDSGVCAHFPAYGDLIECRMRLAHAKKELLERCLIKLNEIISPYRLPRLIGLNILNYLKLSSLQTLTAVAQWRTS